MKITDLLNQRVIIKFANKHGDYSEMGGQITQIDENNIVFAIEENGLIIIKKQNISYICNDKLKIVWRKLITNNYGST